MNKVYRVIFNRALGVYQCVSEIAKSAGKTKSIKTLSLAVAVALSTQALAQNQNYTNGDVTNIQEDVYTADGDIISHRSIVNGKTIDVKSRTLNVTDSGKLNSLAIRTGNASRTNIESGASVITNNLLMEDNSLVALSAGSLGSPSASLQLGVNSKNHNNTSVISAMAKSQIDAQEVFVGFKNNGQFNLNGDSVLTTTQRINIGNQAEGKVVVAGENSAIKADTATIRVGDGNKGELLLQDGTRAAFKEVSVGVLNQAKTDKLPALHGQGQVTLQGKGTHLSTGKTNIAHAGNGTLNVQDSAIFETRDFDAGHERTGQAQIVIKDKQSTLNIKNDATIAKAGNATLIVAKQGNVKVGSNLSIGTQQGSTGTVNLVGDNATDDATKLTVDGGLLSVGVAGEGALNITDGATLQVNTEVSIGKQAGGVGNTTVRRGKLDVTNKTGARYGDLLVGDIAGTGHLTATENSTIRLAKDLVLGHQENATGMALIDSSQVAIGGNLFVGKKGVGELTLQNGAKVAVGADINGDNQSVVYIGGKSNRIDQKSMLTLKDANLQARSVTVGQDGAARLVLSKDSVLKTYLLERGNHEDVNVILDGATITTPEGLVVATSYFKNFTDKQHIEIKDGGVNFLINAGTAQLTTTGKIMGNGTLTKSGAGKLVFAGDTKKWTGGTYIDQGTLTIKGNYTMNDGEVLGIGVNSKDDYGQLDVQGKADISKGVLSIKATDVLANIKNGRLKDVVKAQQLVGKFKEVQNNNPLLAFQTQYEGSNVHLLLNPRITETPNNPPTVDLPIAEIIPGFELAPAPKKPEQPKPEHKVPDNPPTVDLPIAEIIPGFELAPVPKKPEQPKPEHKVPDNPPTVDLPIAEIIPGFELAPAPKKPEQPKPEHKVPDNPPIAEPKPNLDLPQPKFTPAAEQFHARHLLDLAHELDEAYIEAYADLLMDEKNRKNNALGQALLKDGDNLGGSGLSKEQIAYNLNQVNAQLQPLLMGAVNESLLTTQQQRVDSAKAYFGQAKGIWAIATNNENSKEALAGGLTGYTQKDKGVILGAGAAIGGATVGAALSYTDSDIKASTVNHQADIKTTGATFYASQEKGNTLIYGHADISRAKIAGERHIDILKAGTAKSNYDATTYGVGFGVRHRIGTPTRHIAPFVDVAYAQVHSNAYRETGTNYDLTAAKSKQRSFYHQAGVQWQYGLTSKLSLDGVVAGTYNNGDSHSTTSAHFSSTPSASFGIRGQNSKSLCSPCQSRIKLSSNTQSSNWCTVSRTMA